MDFKKSKQCLHKHYWEKKYTEEKVVWDIGTVSKPIADYINSLQNKNLKILIPGAGNAYEADFLVEKGFNNVFVLDFAENPLKNFKNRNVEFPEEHVIQQDFFEHTQTYDIIIEHVFFCALHPALRKKYVEKMYELLNPSGLLIGVLFDFELSEEGPPYGGSIEEYTNLFSEKFHIKKLEKCYNSIKPRFGRELFFIFEKKYEYG